MFGFENPFKRNPVVEETTPPAVEDIRPDAVGETGALGVTLPIDRSARFGGDQIQRGKMPASNEELSRMYGKRGEKGELGTDQSSL